MKSIFNTCISALLLAVSFSSCTPGENTNSLPIKASDSSHVIQDSTQPAKDKNATMPSGSSSPKTDEPSEQKALTDWRPLVKEYHEILCRQHNGVSTTNDKIRLAELTKNFDQLQTQLPLTERSDFIAEKAKAIETEGCQ